MTRFLINWDGPGGAAASNALEMPSGAEAENMEATAAAYSALGYAEDDAALDDGMDEDDEDDDEDDDMEDDM